MSAPDRSTHSQHEALAKALTALEASDLAYALDVAIEHVATDGRASRATQRELRATWTQLRSRLGQTAKRTPR